MTLTQKQHPSLGWSYLLGTHRPSATSNRSLTMERSGDVTASLPAPEVLKAASRGRLLRAPVEQRHGEEFDEHLGGWCRALEASASPSFSIVFHGFPRIFDPLPWNYVAFHRFFSPVFGDRLTAEDFSGVRRPRIVLNAWRAARRGVSEAVWGRFGGLSGRCRPWKARRKSQSSWTTGAKSRSREAPKSRPLPV